MQCQHSLDEVATRCGTGHREAVDGNGLKRTSSSSKTHGIHSELPMLIAPRIGTDTLSPLLPSFTYSALLFSNPSTNACGKSDILLLCETQTD